MSKKYDIQEVFNLLSEDVLNATEPIIKSDSIKIDGYLVYKDSWRYRTFYQKGLKCACCGRVGSYFKLDVNSKNIERAHFNLFSEDGTLMTKDHIIPKSKGGPDCIDNFQTMCQECNKNKANIMPKIIPDVELVHRKKAEIKATRVDKPQDVHFFYTIENAVKWVVKEHLKLYSKSKKNMSREEVVQTVIRATIRLSIALDSTEPYCGYNWERVCI